MLEKFKEMSLTRKFVVGFLSLCVLVSIVSASFFVALVYGTITYLLIITSGLKDSGRASYQESDNEYYSRQQEEDDAYMLQKEEDERLEQERQANEIAFRG